MTEIKTEKLENIKPDLANANRHSERGHRMLRQSMDEFGFAEAGTLDANNRIIGGNHRTEVAADVLGSDEAIVIEVDGSKPVYIKRSDIDLNTERGRRLAYALNRTAQVSIDFDPEQVLADIEQGISLDGLFGQDEIDTLLAEIAPENQGGNGEAPPITEVEAEKYHKEWKAKVGDVWLLGNHKVACLDCLNKDNVELLCDGDKPDMVFADPPYGIDIVAANVPVGGGEAYDIPFGGVNHRRGYVGGGSRHKDKTGRYYIQDWGKDKGLGSTNGAKPFGNEKTITGPDGASNAVEVGKYYPVIGDSTTETAVNSASMLLEMFSDACHIWWGGNYYTEVLPSSPCWIIWDKDNTGNFADCEMAWTNQPTAARIFQHRWNGMLKASEQGQRRIHPTQKPVALAEYCFTQYGKDDELIIDPFLGSGITVLAAQNTNRRVIGFELEPVYISAICQRFYDHTGIKPELIDTVDNG